MPNLFLLPLLLLCDAFFNWNTNFCCLSWPQNTSLLNLKSLVFKEKGIIHFGKIRLAPRMLSLAGGKKQLVTSSHLLVRKLNYCPTCYSSFVIESVSFYFALFSELSLLQMQRIALSWLMSEVLFSIWVNRPSKFSGLWRGCWPNVQRAALVNLGDLSTYDSVKGAILRNTSLKDNSLTHCLSSACAG